MAPSQSGHSPNLDKFIKSLKSQQYEASADTLVSLFKRRQITGTRSCSIATIHVLRQVVAKARYTDVDALIHEVQRVGRRLVHALPHELAIGNVVRRVLGLIRDEAEEDREEFGTDSVSDIQALAPDVSSSSISKEPKEPVTVLPILNRAPTVSTYGHTSFSTPFSMFSLLSTPAGEYMTGSGTGSPMGRSGTSTPLTHAQSASIHALRSEVLEGIDEITDEVEQVDDQIAAYGDIQIHPTDFVLVHEPDSTLEKFLLRAAQKRNFTVLVVRSTYASLTSESSPMPFQQKLNAAGIKTINVMNTGLNAYMSKVNKVIISARGVTADGGVIAEAGSAAVARAAHASGKDVLVLMGIYKLSPENPADTRSLVEWGDPESFISYEKGNVVNTIDVDVPVTEFVPPTLVNIYISNIGVHSRDHLHGLIGDHYNDEDSEFHLIPSVQ